MSVKHSRYRNKGACLRIEYTHQPLSLRSKRSRKFLLSLDTLEYLDRREGICSRIAGAALPPRTNHWSPVQDGNWQNLCHVSQRRSCGSQMSCSIWEYWSGWTHLVTGRFRVDCE